MEKLKTLLKTTAFAGVVALSSVANAQSTEPLNVVASFSVLGDMVAQVGGDAINLTVLVGANEDAHVFAPTPSDAASVSSADLMIINGLEFEGWLPRLIESAGYEGATLVATTGIGPLGFGEEGHDDHNDEHGEEGHDDHNDEHGEEGHDDHKDEDGQDDHAGHNHGAFDPHAWQSVELALVYVQNIADALVAADAANAATYQENATAYLAELAALHAQLLADFGALPADKRKVVTAHDAFGYFAHEYGVEFVAPQGLSTESEASAQDVANIIRQIRDEGISAVFVENISDTRLIEQIVSETGAVVGGTLFSDALSDASGPASTYVDMIRHNSSEILGALQ